MFGNAIIGGGLAAAYLAVLFLQLNPEVPLYPTNLVPLVATLAVLYGVVFALVFYAFTVLRQIFAPEVFSPGWISIRMLAWLLLVDAGGAAVLMWLNLRDYGAMLPAMTTRRMAGGAAALTAVALMYLTVAVIRYTFGRRRGRIGGSFIALGLAVSFVVPLIVRGAGSPRPLASRPIEIDPGLPEPVRGSHVTMILLDGASLDFVSAATLEGKLPNFGKILDGGAALHLATIRPTQPEPVWTAAATGKLPSRNGVRSWARYIVPSANDPLELLPDFCFAQGLLDLGLLTARPHNSTSLRARPLWSILGSAGLSVSILNWPLTYPVQPVRGTLVSDAFFRSPGTQPDTEEMGAIYPPDMGQAARSLGESPERAQDLPLVRAPWPSGDPYRAVLEGQTFVTDRLYEALARHLQETQAPNLSAVRIRELDAAGHTFLRFSMPRQFGDVTPEERQRYGTVLENTYGRVDAMVGRALAAAGPDDLVLVVSGYGMEPMSLGKRFLERYLGNRELSGSHESAPDGFLLAYGRVVEPGRKRRGEVADLAPTVLYYLGLPVARDMDGAARTDLFRRDFTDARPLAVIPTYER